MFTIWMNLEKTSARFVSHKWNSLTFPNFALKFPNFSEFHEISWLFSSSTIFPDFFRFPEISGPLAILLMYALFRIIQGCFRLTTYWLCAETQKNSDTLESKGGIFCKCILTPSHYSKYEINVFFYMHNKMFLIESRMTFFIRTFTRSHKRIRFLYESSNSML